MMLTHETTTHSVPARRRSASAVPVLIRVPNLNASQATHRRVRRRRLRREFRIAGYAMLALITMTLVFTAIVGRLPTLSASSRNADLVADLETSADRRIREMPAVSLSVEPVASVARDPERPVFLPGILWPADSTEEAGDGGH